MSPASNSSIASFSFLAPASQPVVDHPSSAARIPGSTSAIQPPSDQVLSSASTRTVTGRSNRSCLAGIATLPTKSLYLIQSWLRDKESLQLLMTGHHLQNGVQSFYRMYLRPAEAQRTLSPIASAQHSCNLLPKSLGLGSECEQAFQQCLALKASFTLETEYCSSVLQLLKTHLSQPRTWHNVIHTTAGFALGLGGTSITVESRTALLDFILGSYKTFHPHVMGGMVMGVRFVLNVGRFGNRHFQVILEKILSSHTTSNPAQMEAMIIGLFRQTGKHSLTREGFEWACRQILNFCKTSSPLQADAVICGLCKSFGGVNISPIWRDFLLQQILSTQKQCAPEQLPRMISGLCRGLGNGHMSNSNLDAVLALIFDACRNLDIIYLNALLAYLCRILGAGDIRQEHRDTVLAKILSVSATTAPHQMGAMIRSLCDVLGGKQMHRQIRSAVTERILATHETSTPEQIRVMLHCLAHALGGAAISPKNRDELLKQILALTRSNPKLPLRAILRGLFGGIGGRAMTGVNVDAILFRILDLPRPRNLPGTYVGLNRLCETLGGQTMSPEHRDSILVQILASKKTSGLLAGRLIYSLCRSLGGSCAHWPEKTGISIQNLDALITRILQLEGLCSPGKMRKMVRYLLLAIGGQNSSLQHRTVLAWRIQQMGLVSEIAAAMQQTSNGRADLALLALDTPITRSPHPDFLSALPTRLTGKINDWLRPEESLRLTRTSHRLQNSAQSGLRMPQRVAEALSALSRTPNSFNTDVRFPQIVCSLCEALGARQISNANLNAVLAMVFAAHEKPCDWNLMHLMVSLSGVLGNVTMSPQHRDTLLAKMLPYCATCTLDEMSYMTRVVVHAFVGLPIAVPTAHTRANLDAIIRQVVHSYPTTGALRTGAMLVCLFGSLGGKDMAAAHLQIMVAAIQESEHFHDIIAAIKLNIHGEIMHLSGQVVAQILLSELTPTKTGRKSS